MSQQLFSRFYIAVFHQKRFTSSESKSDFISLKRFLLGSHIALLTLLVSSCAIVFKQPSRAICCPISDQVCFSASSDKHHDGSNAIAIFNTSTLFISATRSLKTLVEAAFNLAT